MQWRKNMFFYLKCLIKRRIKPHPSPPCRSENDICQQPKFGLFIRAYGEKHRNEGPKKQSKDYMPYQLTPIRGTKSSGFSRTYIFPQMFVKYL